MHARCVASGYACLPPPCRQFFGALQFFRADVGYCATHTGCSALPVWTQPRAYADQFTRDQFSRLPLHWLLVRAAPFLRTPWCSLRLAGYGFCYGSTPAPPALPDCPSQPTVAPRTVHHPDVVPGTCLQRCNGFFPTPTVPPFCTHHDYGRSAACLTGSHTGCDLTFIPAVPTTNVFTFSTPH